MRPVRLLLLLVSLAAPVNTIAQVDKIALPELVQRAESGDVDAQWVLGARYDSGNGVERDGQKAEYWYRRAGVAGSSEAQNSLGSGYQARKQYEEAFSWYERAANQGHALAINNLASMYALGLGTKQDRAKGFELYMRSAELGWAEAMWNIANDYGGGLGREKDLYLAYVWSLRALKYVEPSWRQRLAPAERAARYLERTLPPEQISRGKEESEKWSPKAVWKFRQASEQ